MAYEKSEDKLLQPGAGTFTVVGAYDKDRDDNTKPLISKASGAPMIKLLMIVADCYGNETRTNEYVTINTMWRLKNLLDAAGRPSLYKPWGEFAINSLIGLSGNCVLKSDTFNDKTSTKIDKYTNPVKQAPQIELPDDEIPF